MPDMKCFIDESCAKRVAIDSGEFVLGWFLEQDVQSSFKSCQFLIDVVEKVHEGKMLSWEGTGNAHSITITKESVHIYNEYSNDECTYSTAFFIEALNLWCEFITRT